MGMHRFTRLTNAFSKKVESLAAAVSLHFMHYNLGRAHQSLTITRPMGDGSSSGRRSPVVDLRAGRPSGSAQVKLTHPS